MPVASKVMPGSLAESSLALQPFLGAQQRALQPLDRQPSPSASLAAVIHSRIWSSSRSM